VAESAEERAVKFLQDRLQNGPVVSEMLFDDAKAAGISRSTLQRALAKLKVDAVKDDGATMMRLPE
jgi:membrane-bound lytic murein transglycosylase B